MSVKDNDATKFLPGKNSCALFVKNEIMKLQRFNGHVGVSKRVQLNEHSDELLPDETSIECNLMLGFLS